MRAGDSVLDAGGGTGSTAFLAARRAGSSGRVTLLDFCEQMLAVARDRAHQQNLVSRTNFVVGDLLALPFADGSFDAVVATYSVCPLHSPQDGALELFRVLKRGGRLGVAHSARPPGASMRWLAARFDDVLWRLPRVSMGCRAVSVLPTLERAGGRLVFERRFGVPLYPFFAFVVEKPDDSAS